MKGLQGCIYFTESIGLNSYLFRNLPINNIVKSSDKKIRHRDVSVIVCLYKAGKESAMKIENSKITMASSHSAYSYSEFESTSIDAISEKNNPLAAIMKISDEGSLSYKESIEAYKAENEELKKQQQEENLANSFKAIQEQEEKAREANGGRSQWDFNADYDMKLSLLEKMFELLRNGKLDSKSAKRISKEGVLDLRSFATNSSSFKLSYSNEKSSSVAQEGIVYRKSTTWTKITATSGTTSEYENTKFASTGQVLTSDGRSIDFNVEVTLGRAATKHFDSISASSYIVTDPLVINLDTTATSVSDQKFLFDIDSDGKEENISFAGKGSGFLALDKNGDGKINDGSELFGTKSGDGFADLAAYDEDNNGWIDENDSVFNKLKVWTKDEDGNDRLIDLKQADVGAIFLGSAETEFSQKDADLNTQAIIRKTGIYIKESTGQASTIAHVDLTL